MKGAMNTACRFFLYQNENFVSLNDASGNAGNILRNPILLWVLLVLWVCAFLVIIYLGLKPTPLSLEHPADKFLHAASCAIVVMLPALLLRRLSYLLISIAVLFAAGAGIEVYQSFLPGREASLSDLLADATGIIIGVAMARVLLHFYRK